MSHRRLNLASEPFLNLRPVRRVTFLLWVLAVTLLAVNAFLYWRNFSGRGEAREALVELDRELQSEGQRLAELELEVSRLLLSEQNQQVEFLNQKIARRTFSWSALFDRLAEALPRDVRINRLSPKLARQGRSASAAAESGEVRERRVLLEISAEAKDDSVILELLDSLFAHPSFEGPDLRSESPTPQRTVRFELVATYLPGREARHATDEGEEPAGVESSEPPPSEEIVEDTGRLGP